MAAIVRNGWEIFFYTPLFAAQRREYRKIVNKLKVSLSDEDYREHADVKLFAALMSGIKEKIVLNPYHSNFALTEDLKRYGRLKHMGLPNRYRLFFRAFQEENRKVLIVLWLGYPRKEGAKNDCYAVFSKMVASGVIPDTMNELIKNSES